MGKWCWNVSLREWKPQSRTLISTAKPSTSERWRHAKLSRPGAEGGQGGVCRGWWKQEDGLEVWGRSRETCRFLFCPHSAWCSSAETGSSRSPPDPSTGRCLGPTQGVPSPLVRASSLHGNRADRQESPNIWELSLFTKEKDQNEQMEETLKSKH